MKFEIQLLRYGTWRTIATRATLDEAEYAVADIRMGEAGDPHPNEYRVLVVDGAYVEEAHP